MKQEIVMSEGKNIELRTQSSEHRVLPCVLCSVLCACLPAGRFHFHSFPIFFILITGLQYPINLCQILKDFNLTKIFLS